MGTEARDRPNFFPTLSLSRIIIILASLTTFCFIFHAFITFSSAFLGVHFFLSFNRNETNFSVTSFSGHYSRFVIFFMLYPYKRFHYYFLSAILLFFPRISWRFHYFLIRFMPVDFFFFSFPNRNESFAISLALHVCIINLASIFSFCSIVGVSIIIFFRCSSNCFLLCEKKYNAFFYAAWFPTGTSILIGYTIIICAIIISVYCPKYKI